MITVKSMYTIKGKARYAHGPIAMHSNPAIIYTYLHFSFVNEYLYRFLNVQGLQFLRL